MAEKVAEVIQMTSHSGADGAAPSYNPAAANWNWLSDRLNAEALETTFQKWLDGQLLTLEDDFAAMVTHRSRNRCLRKVLRNERERGNQSES